MRTLLLVVAAALILSALPRGAGATIRTFTVQSIDGAQETPPNASASTGSGTFRLDTSNGFVNFDIDHDCCTSGEIAAHVHGPAGPGMPAPIVYGLPGGNSKSGGVFITAQQQADMLNDLHYVNIHSNAFSDGEIRGQILLDPIQYVPTKLLRVKNPDPVLNPPLGAFKRSIVWKGKELASSNTITGDPTSLVTGGATLRVVLRSPSSHPPTDQCFELPAGNWSRITTIGYRYRDADLSEGAVRVASITKNPAGTFLIKMALKGSGPQTITVFPRNPTDEYEVVFRIRGGAEYCTHGPGVTPLPNDERTFRVRNDSPAGFPCVSACSASGAFLEEARSLF